MPFCLLCQFLLNQNILVISLRKSVAGINSELFNDLESLNCFEFDGRIVVLHIFQIAYKSFKLTVQETFEEFHILPLVVVLIKQFLNFCNLNHLTWTSSRITCKLSFWWSNAWFCRLSLRLRLDCRFNCSCCCWRLLLNHSLLSFHRWSSNSGWFFIASTSLTLQVVDWLHIAFTGNWLFSLFLFLNSLS